MALRDIDTEEMLGLSANWVKGGPHHEMLKTHPRTASFLADIQASHEALLATQPSGKAGSDDLVRLLEKEVLVDDRHDRSARAVSFFLQGHIEVAPDDAARSLYRQTLKILLPDGLGVVNRNYSAEAGAAALTEQRLNARADIVALLKASPGKPGKSLHELVIEWLDAGKLLGDLEAQRHTLEQQLGDQPIISRSDRVQARNRWIRTVRTMQGSIELDKEPSVEIRAAVLAPLAQADARAIQGGRKEPEGPDPVG